MPYLCNNLAAKPFRGELAVVATQDGTFGYIDKKGNRVWSVQANIMKSETGDLDELDSYGDR